MSLLLRRSRCPAGMLNGVDDVGHRRLEHAVEVV